MSGGGGGNRGRLRGMGALNPLVLYVYLKLCTFVIGMFDVVYTKLNVGSGNYVVELAYRVCALSQVPRRKRAWRKI